MNWFCWFRFPIFPNLFCFHIALWLFGLIKTTPWIKLCLATLSGRIYPLGLVLWKYTCKWDNLHWFNVNYDPFLQGCRIVVGNLHNWTYSVLHKYSNWSCLNVVECHCVWTVKGIPLVIFCSYTTPNWQCLPRTSKVCITSVAWWFRKKALGCSGFEWLSECWAAVWKWSWFQLL